jgi:hypothetical protein
MGSQIPAECRGGAKLLYLSNSAEAEGAGPDNVPVGDGTNARAIHKKSDGLCGHSARSIAVRSYGAVRSVSDSTDRCRDARAFLKRHGSTGHHAFSHRGAKVWTVLRTVVVVLPATTVSAAAMSSDHDVDDDDYNHDYHHDHDDHDDHDDAATAVRAATAVHHHDDHDHDYNHDDHGAAYDNHDDHDTGARAHRLQAPAGAGATAFREHRAICRGLLLPVREVEV